MALKLFRTDSAPFEKEGSLSVHLSNPPEDWEQEIMDYAFRFHPWLSEFVLTVDFIKKMADRRYGVGGITITAAQPLVAASPSAAKSPMGGANTQDVVLAHIPVVVREGTLAPLDVFISDNDVLPLREDTFRKRIGGALDARSTSTSRSDPTLIGHLWPPGRSSFGGPGADMGLSVLNKFSSMDDATDDTKWLLALHQVGEDEVGTMKQASGYPLCDAILQGKCRYDRTKVASFVDAISGSYYLSQEIGPVLNKIVENLPEDRPARGTIAQLLKSASGYEMRTTDPSNFRFGPAVPVDVDGLLPTQVFSALQPVAQERAEEKVADCESADFGSVEIRDAATTRKGVLFSSVYDFTGEKTASMLFSDRDNKEWSLESGFSLVGAAQLADIPNDAVKPGTGVFVFRDGEKVACTLPVTIHTKRASASGPVYKATIHTTKLAGDYALNTQVNLYVSPAVTEPTYVQKTSSLMVPASYSWHEIGESSFHPYAPLRVDRNVVSLGKLASNTYTLSGNPVANVVREPLSYEDAQLVLGAIGVPVENIDGLLKRASDGVTLVNCRSLRAYREPVVALPDTLDTELLKSAAAVGDPNSVDAVMGLNLMDTETEDNFMILAQNLEDTQQKVARLLLMSRLGLHAVPEGACKVVMTRLSPIVDSLKVLAMQNAYGG